MIKDHELPTECNLKQLVNPSQITSEDRQEALVNIETKIFF